MPDNFDSIKTELKASKNVYSLLSRLKGYNSPIFEVRQMITRDGHRYKLVQLTPRGIAQGEQDHISTARQFLNAYDGSERVPKLVYADSERLIVEWLDGTVLDESNLSEQDCTSLGRFIASSVRDERLVNGDRVMELLGLRFEELIGRGVLKPAMAKSLTGMFNGTIPTPGEVPVAICFGDTNLKNFLRNRDGSWRYIDVMGIYRAPVGWTFARQLVWLPARFRASFTSAYIEASPYPEILEYLPFYYLVFLIDRIHVKTRPAGLLQWRYGRRRRKKARIALRKLANFEQAVDKRESLADWIMHV